MKVRNMFALTAFCAVILVIGMPAFAVQLTPQAAQSLNDPANYARVSDGTVVFNKTATAYSPDELDMLLNAYGVSLTPEAAQALEGPTGYATVRGGDIVFGKNPTAYSPDLMHEILTAYGLCLTPEAVTSGDVAPSYAVVRDGNIVFGTTGTAYSPDVFNGILNAYELCQKPVVAEPAPADDDGDGVPNDRDRCPNTPRGVTIDSRGCPLDSDGDGVADYLDRCPNTMGGAIVDAQGCPLDTGEKPAPMDSDGDGVYDERDQCPGTPQGAVVNEVGCWVVGNLLFDYDRAEIRPQYYSDLDQVVRVLKRNPGMHVEIQGHTDNVGSKRYNEPLSLNRAKAVANYLLRHGISKDRLTVKGYWFSRPVAPNTTPEGRQKNRRVEIHPIY